MKPTASKILLAASVALFALAVALGHVSGVGAHDLGYLGLGCLGASLLVS